MLVYQDLLSGDELLSDSFPHKDIFNGILWEVDGKWIEKGPTPVNIASNPPFEGVAEDEKVEDKSVKVIDIVDAFILQEVPALDEAAFSEYMKKFISKLTPLLSAERQNEFKTNVDPAVKWLNSMLRSVKFYKGENMKEDASFVYAYNKEGAADPTFIYFADALKAVES